MRTPQYRDNEELDDDPDQWEDEDEVDALWGDFRDRLQALLFRDGLQKSDRESARQEILAEHYDEVRKEVVAIIRQQEGAEIRRAAIREATQSILSFTFAGKNGQSSSANQDEDQFDQEKVRAFIEEIKASLRADSEFRKELKKELKAEWISSLLSEDETRPNKRPETNGG